MDSIWRMRCREYSQKFHTPLHLVLNELDPVFVLQQLYESEISPSAAEDETEELLDILYKKKDPNYSRMSSEEIEELVDNVINREIKRNNKKKAPTQETISEEIKKAEVKPKSGSTTFKDLERLDSDQESNLSGFDD
ncbi:unnamed protein product [Sphagnum balticum]